MKLIQPQNTVKIEGSLDSSKIEIAENAMDQVAILLRDKIYTDKVISPIRELTANAVDEHTKFNIEKLVKIHLPTDSQPYFSVRDFGKGLSKENVFGIFFTYFSSTKQNDRKTIGSWGLGSKSPFALVDTFTVTSFFDKKKSVYIGINLGRNCEAHLSSVESSSEESGIEVSFEVKDVHTFRSKFAEFYKYFKHYAILDIENPVNIEDIEIEEGKIYQRINSVVYKGICYQHDFKLCKFNIQLKIPDNVILAIHPSRERLEQIPINETALRAFFNDYAAKMVKEFEDNFPEDRAAQWKTLSSISNLLWESGIDKNKYKKCPTTGYTSKWYNFYVIEGYGARKLKKETYFDHKTPILYTKRKSVSANLAEMIDQNHPENRILVICAGERSFEETKEDLRRMHPYGDANLIDISDYNPPRQPRRARAKIEGISVLCFRNNSYMRVNEDDFKKTVYYTEVCSKEITSKVLDNRLAKVLAAKINLFGIAKSNIKTIPETWVRVEPLVKSIRRKVNTVGIPDLLFNDFPYCPKYKFKNLLEFSPKRIKRRGKEMQKKHQKGLDALHKMRESDLEFNLRMAATQNQYYLPYQFQETVKQQIQDQVTKTYENIL